jgi:RNA-binding protein 5/10
MAKAARKDGQTIEPSNDIDTEDSNYRDRAHERRTIFHQPKKPAYNPYVKTPSTLESQHPEPLSFSLNKGQALMTAMGWSQGSGLGAAGSGRVEPIQAQSYEAGVGLGAGTVKTVGKDIGVPQDDGGYGSFVKKVRENARSRFENLD